MTKILISAGPVSMNAELNESGTAKRILDILPIAAKANTWGDEIYFSIPVEDELENGQEVVEMGDLGYWPPGTAFCIFFGKTPASHGDEIRPASPVNVVGKLLGDPKAFKKARPGASVKIERI